MAPVIPAKKGKLLALVERMCMKYRYRPLNCRRPLKCRFVQKNGFAWGCEAGVWRRAFVLISPKRVAIERAEKREEVVISSSINIICVIYLVLFWWHVMHMRSISTTHKHMESLTSKWKPGLPVKTASSNRHGLAHRSTGHGPVRPSQNKVFAPLRF